VTLTESSRFLARMSELVPGGASSNARCGSPIAIARGEGAELIDLDGNRYIDYVLGFGPVLLGHGHPPVTEAVARAVRDGTTFAFSQELEYAVAQGITRLYPSVEMVRLCNSGTDAATTCYRIAAAHTGAHKLVKIEGDYNGGFDLLLCDIPGVEAERLGSGPNVAGRGVLPATADLVVTVAFNNADALESVLRRYAGQVAAVFMEPILGNTAAIMPEPGYLEAVRSLCDRFNVVLVFDEVKTGFRVARGGAQELLRVNSDLTMLGKALGNGMPIAAVGGKRHLMELVRPGGVHHCGTYFGNLPCTAAAQAVLAALDAADYGAARHRGERLAAGICSLLRQADIPAHWHGVGTMFGITIGEKRPTDYRTWWLDTQRRTWMQIAAELRSLGVLTDGFIGLSFVSFAHTDNHIDATLAACKEAIRRFKSKR
jgi:glutamate-1-semialdehyde 2,1-aminomutase